jgi:hypothetical protein
MSDVPDAPATPEIQPGVMSSLPKTRPQRPSARRASARQTTTARSAATDDGTAQTRSTRAKTARKKRPAPRAEPPRAPRQGFEAESEIETGSPVAPPGGVELAASVVELLGELAQSGLRALLRRPSD